MIVEHQFTMAPTFLQILPWEARNQIHKNVLASPTEIIYISRVPALNGFGSHKVFSHNLEDFEEIWLSMLRTCRQFYEECKDKLWIGNTLDIESSIGPNRYPDGRSGVFFGLHISLVLNVRSIRLDLSLIQTPHAVPLGEGEPYTFVQYFEANI